MSKRNETTLAGSEQLGGMAAVEWLDPQRLTRSEWLSVDQAGRGAGILLGKYDGRIVGSTDDRHCMTVVGAGGRGVQQSLIVPNLLHYDGSMLVVDRSGDLARATARARWEKGQTVVVLDPFGVSGIPTGGFNPLASLDPASPTVIDDAALLAESLIVAGSAREPHWTNSARVLVAAAILFVLTLPEEERNLATVHGLICGDHKIIEFTRSRLELDDTMAAFIAVLRLRSDLFNGVLANFGATFAAMPDRERATVFSTARVQFAFLQSPSMQKVLERSDVTMADLKCAPTTVYLCLPVSRMETHSRWLRLIISVALAEFERTKATSEIPVLVILNEFASLPRLERLETGAAVLTECGVRLWIIVHCLDLLRVRYADAWHTLIAGAGVMTFWQVHDDATINFITKRTGLVRPELERLLAAETQRCLVLSGGQAPVMLQRLDYKTDAAFVCCFDP